MDPNKKFLKTKNSSNFPLNYPNQFQNNSPNQSQTVPNYGFPPNCFTSSSISSYPPYYGSMMSYSSQPPPNLFTPTSNEVVSNVGANEFPKFSTQMTLSSMGDATEAKQDAEGTTHARRKHSKWTTDQNLVLLSGWMKYGADSVLGRNQKTEAFWGKIADYCNEYCSFDRPRDGDTCRNHYNYINKMLNKWIGAYDNAKRMQQSGWSENDVLTKANALYSSGKNSHFNLLEEWKVVRDQPRYSSQVGGNTGSRSSGSKRSRESDGCDSNSIGSISRPMGRDATKKKVKTKARVNPLK